MFESTTELDAIMFRLLTQIKDKHHSGEIFSKLGDASFDKAVEKCVWLGLVKGVFPQRMARGNLTVDINHAFGITEQGLRFIEDYNRHNHS